MKGFEITTEGKYFARSGVMEGERILKDYKIVCRLPSMKAALSVIKNKVLTAGLKKKYADYIAYQTHVITKVTPLDDESAKDLSKAEVSYMDRSALLSFIKEYALPVAAKYYPGLAALREAVSFCKEDEKGYLKKFELRKDDLAADIEVARMNPEIFAKENDEEETEEIIPEEIVAPAPKQKKKKRLNTKANAKVAKDRVDALAKDEFTDANEEDEL